ncbi:hypothetical protein [Coleofasciculus sp. H7-2]
MNCRRLAAIASLPLATDNNLWALYVLYAIEGLTRWEHPDDSKYTPTG